MCLLLSMVIQDLLWTFTGRNCFAFLLKTGEQVDPPFKLYFSFKWIIIQGFKEVESLKYAQVY